MVTSTACLKADTSNWPPELTNFMRLSDARLQAVSSKNIYSLQGFDALMRAVFLEVCQRFTVVSYCIPGSPQCQVESATFSSNSRALSFSFGCPSITLFVHQSRLSCAAR